MSSYSFSDTAIRDLDEICNYIVFYYPSSDGINIARVISGHRDLEDLF